MAFASINQASVGGGSSNALAIQSDGIFMPRLSTAQRTALALTTSDNGLTVYDFTLNNLFIWNGTAWESIPGSGDAGANGSVQYNDNGIVSGATNFVYDKATDQVGIGTATPIYKLHAVVTSGAVAKFGASTAAIARLLVGNTVGDLEVKINANADGQITSDAGKYLGLGSNTSNDRVILTTTGNLSITNGNVVMATSGTGIDFSATTSGSGTMTSELLNDYEEGTFTATLNGSVANPTTTQTATGRYTKVGRQVTVQVFFSNANTTGASGRIQILGLPFANNASVEAISNVAFYSMATFTGIPVGITLVSGTTIDMYSSQSGAVYQPVTYNAGAVQYLWANLTYTV